ncbi:MAG: cbb3-type cytochrome c oxidase subunit I [Chitinophagaceae bacterium]|nr:cbb3-type cytochrome c oxidase subunit I [Chitinophagaceae bacterium]
MSTLEISQVEKKKERKLAIIWAVTFLIVFPLLVILGLYMRLNQGKVVELDYTKFYAFMTMHGLGMAGVLFSVAFAGLWYLISTRITRLSLGVGYFVYFTVLIGFLALAYGTLIGNFAAGWYMLYPLPFKGASWATWSTQVSAVALILMGIAWLVGILHLLYALTKRYGGFFNLLGWQYLRKGDHEKLPSVVLIATVALIPGIFAFLAGAVMLIMYLLQTFEPSLAFNPLLMKNLTFFFGHMLVNVTLYCGVGWVYALMPEFTKREWKVDKVVVYSWNATFFFIVFAYLHHLYMDFAQPRSMQYIGQIFSYMSAVPATAVTMFGIIAQVYHSKMKWSIFPLMSLFGMMGWAIGGFAALVDTTIAINVGLHNTLWVPAHFHTYMLMGVVLFIFGYLFYLFSGEEGIHLKNVTGKAGFWLFVIGAYGFLLMFYLSGINGVPRRFADYQGIEAGHVKETGTQLARYAAMFIYLILLGLLVMYWSLFAKLTRRQKASAW